MCGPVVVRCDPVGHFIREEEEVQCEGKKRGDIDCSETWDSSNEKTERVSPRQCRICTPHLEDRPWLRNQGPDNNTGGGSGGGYAKPSPAGNNQQRGSKSGGQNRVDITRRQSNFGRKGNCCSCDEITGGDIQGDNNKEDISVSDANSGSVPAEVECSTCGLPKIQRVLVRDEPGQRAEDTKADQASTRKDSVQVVASADEQAGVSESREEWKDGADASGDERGDDAVEGTN